MAAPAIKPRTSLVTLAVLDNTDCLQSLDLALQHVTLELAPDVFGNLGLLRLVAHVVGSSQL